MVHPTPDALALIALGEDVEAVEVDHVDECRACFAEVEALQQVVAVGRSLGPEDRLVAPHPRVWQRVADSLHDGRVIPLPGAVALDEPSPVAPPARPEPTPLGGYAGDVPRATPRGTSRPSPRGRRRRTVALAAAAALVVGLGGGFLVRGLVTPGPGTTSTQLNALPQFPGVNGTASLERGADGQRTLTVTMSMPPDLHPDGTLEVWLSDSKAQNMVPMGTMSGLSGQFPVPASMDLTTHPIIDVSLEPVGDTDPDHSPVSVVRGRLAT